MQRANLARVANLTTAADPGGCHALDPGCPALADLASIIRQVIYPIVLGRPSGPKVVETCLLGEVVSGHDRYSCARVGEVANSDPHGWTEPCLVALFVAATV